MTTPVVAHSPWPDRGQERLRVLIVDDHALIAQGVAVALDAEGIEARVTTGPTVAAVLDTAEMFDAHVVLLDLQLGELGDGRRLIEPLRALGGTVLVVSGVTDRATLAECLEAGAVGLASKSDPFDDLVAKVVAAGRGERITSERERWELLDELRALRQHDAERLAPFRALTAREAEVLGHLMEGRQAEAIAEMSFVSLSTVRSQIRSILSKLGVRSQLAAVALARDARWSPS